MIQPFFDEDDDFEMPCVCDCGRVFDLHYGANDPHSNKILCRKCGEQKQKIYDLEQEIDSLQFDIECEHIGKREGNKRIKELKAKMKDLQD